MKPPTRGGSTITDTNGSTPAVWQAEVDTLDTVNSARLIFDAYAQGRIVDVAALENECNVVLKQIHRLRVCRINERP